jgi:hypothetical protein
VIGIVSRIGDDKFGRGCFEKSAGLRGVAFLARGEDETDRASSPRTAVDLGAQARLASVRWPDFEPPFCTAGVLVSADNRGVLIRYSKSGSSDMASKTRCQNSLRPWLSSDAITWVFPPKGYAYRSLIPRRWGSKTNGCSVPALIASDFVQAVFSG